MYSSTPAEQGGSAERRAGSGPSNRASTTGAVAGQIAALDGAFGATAAVVTPEGVPAGPQQSLTRVGFPPQHPGWNAGPLS